MADVYADIAAMARDLLAPTSAGGLGQGMIEIVRRNATPGANPWDDPTVTETSEVVRGVVRGIDRELIGTPAGEGGAVFLASDRVAICAPPIDYAPNDLLEIDGRAVTVLRVEAIPAAGTVAAVKLYVRG